MSETPYVLLPYQQRWVADKATVKICEKSRRIGLTWAEAAENVLTASATIGNDVLYVGYNKEMAREYIETCAWWVANFKVVAEDVEESVLEDDNDICVYSIRFSSSHKILALSGRPNNLRGKKGDVVIDEAAFVDDLDELIKAAMALTIWGGRVRIISTHDGADNPFNIRLKEAQKEGSKVSVHRITFADAIADGLYKRICLQTGQDVAKETEWVRSIEALYGDDVNEELYCIPKNGSGQFFKPGLVAACAAAGAIVLRLRREDVWAQKQEERRAAEIDEWCKAELPKINANDICDVGMDYGRRVDNSIITAIARQAGVCRVILVIELSNIPYSQQRQILKFLIKSITRLGRVLMDASGSGASLAEETADFFGGQVIGISLSQRWYGEFFPALRTAFENQTIQIPDDPELVGDFKSVVAVNGIPTISAARTRSKTGGQRHGDFPVSLVLAYAASLEDPLVYRHVRVRMSDAGAPGLRGVRATRGCRYGLFGGDDDGD